MKKSALKAQIKLMSEDLLAKDKLCKFLREKVDDYSEIHRDTVNQAYFLIFLLKKRGLNLAITDPAARRAYAWLDKIYENK